MTRFEQIGIDRQYNANNAYEAEKLFKTSCTRCCTNGIQLSCDKCNIAYVHEIVVDYFHSKQHKINNKGA